MVAGRVEWLARGKLNKIKGESEAPGVKSIPGASDLFLDTLRQMVTSSVLTFEKLTAW